MSAEPSRRSLDPAEEPGEESAKDFGTEPVATPSPRARRVLGIGLALVVLLVLVPLATVALQVEDWSRDLTTNVARSAPGHPDPRLRPVVDPRSVDALAHGVEELGTSLPGWSLAEDTAEGGIRVLRFVRTSALFRFKDDVTVRIEDRGPERVIHAESRSRVGKGDLGQNPRNLRQLLEGLRRHLTRESGR